MAECVPTPRFPGVFHRNDAKTAPSKRANPPPHARVKVFLFEA